MRVVNALKSLDPLSSTNSLRTSELQVFVRVVAACVLGLRTQRRQRRARLWPARRQGGAESGGKQWVQHVGVNALDDLGALPVLVPARHVHNRY